MLSSFGEKIFHHIHCVSHTKLQTASQCSMSFVLWLVAHRLTPTALCVCTLSSWIQHSILGIILFSQIWVLQNSIFLGSRSWQNVHVISQSVSSCMQIPCIHEAPFSSLLSRNGSCLPRQLTAWIRLLHTGRSHIIVRQWDGLVRACKNTVRCPDDCPFQSHRHDVPDVEFKKRTPILAAFKDVCLSGLRRAFAGFSSRTRR